MDLFKEYGNSFELLEKLFPNRVFNKKEKEKLNNAYMETERLWLTNLKRLKNIEIHYLLIAEAPPEPEKGEIKYFYKSFDNPWNRQIWKSFFEDKKIPCDDSAFNELAKMGFLLIDSLPFCIKYEKRGRAYKELLESVSTFLVNKINNPKIKWAKKVEYAFALKSTGNCINKIFPMGIPLPNGQKIEFEDTLWIGNNYGSLQTCKIKCAFKV